MNNSCHPAFIPPGYARRSKSWDVQSSSFRKTCLPLVKSQKLSQTERKSMGHVQYVKRAAAKPTAVRCAQALTLDLGQCHLWHCKSVNTSHQVTALSVKTTVGFTCCEFFAEDPESHGVSKLKLVKPSPRQRKSLPSHSSGRCRTVRVRRDQRTDEAGVRVGGHDPRSSASISVAVLGSTRSPHCSLRRVEKLGLAANGGCFAETAGDNTATTLFRLVTCKVSPPSTDASTCEVACFSSRIEVCLM